VSLAIKLLAIAYAAVAIVNTIAYWPTIKDLYYHKKKSANLWSYILWTAASLVTLLYAIFILPDPLFIVVSALGFLCCGAIMILCIVLDRNAIDKNPRRRIK